LLKRRNRIVIEGQESEKGDVKRRWERGEERERG
jgi:hypothetical protein